jgi:hypothetical protein
MNCDDKKLELPELLKKREARRKKSLAKRDMRVEALKKLKEDAKKREYHKEKGNTAALGRRG